MVLIKNYFLITLAILLTGSGLFKVDLILAADVDVKLELFPAVQTSQMLFLSDFDLMKLGEGPLLFRITMINLSTHELNLIGKFSIESQNLGVLLSGETKPFVLPAGSTILTNRELFSRTSKYGLENYDFSSASDDLKRMVLQTGKLPPDQYDFKWEVSDVQNNSNTDSEIVSIIINNPTSLDLIAPGANSGAGSVPILFTVLPYFRWESGAVKFQLTVCEQEDLNQSPEEVMQNTPRLQTIVENAKAYQYPSVGAWPLEEGKIYFWQVMAFIQTSTGEVELPSEIWGFRLANLNSGLSAIQQMQIVSSLRSLLGDSAVEILFGPNGELYGFEVTGVALLGGKPISIEEILKLIEDINSGKIKVKEMKVLD